MKVYQSVNVEKASIGAASLIYERKHLGIIEKTVANQITAGVEMELKQQYSRLSVKEYKECGANFSYIEV